MDVAEARLGPATLTRIERYLDYDAWKVSVLRS